MKRNKIKRRASFKKGYAAAFYGKTICPYNRKINRQVYREWYYGAINQKWKSILRRAKE